MSNAWSVYQVSVCLKTTEEELEYALNSLETGIMFYDKPICELTLFYK